LGTISNSITFFQNEGGSYPIIQTDEHGFNNPKGLYKKNKLDVVLIGDSYTEGISVEQNQSIAAILRKMDLNTLSLGKGSNGPLLELATLKEFAEYLKPKVVIWIFFTNDLIDLNIEMQSSMLQNYLNENDFSQSLITRQKEIDKLLISYLRDQEIKHKKHQVVKRKIIALSIIRLKKIQKILKKVYQKPPPIFNNPVEEHRSTFKLILSKSNKMVSSWGGKMYIVYLPPFPTLKYGINDPDRDFFIQTVDQSGIPLIDMQFELLNAHSDPLSLYPLENADGMAPHFNAEGYHLIAEKILLRLNKDGIFN
jgi:hypothetical protein